MTDDRDDPLILIPFTRDWRWIAPHWRLWLKAPVRCFRVWSGTDGTYKRRPRYKSYEILRAKIMADPDRAARVEQHRLRMMDEIDDVSDERR